MGVCFSPEEIRHLVARASSLGERAGWSAGDTPAATLTRRMAAWEKAVSGGQPGVFEERLARLGHTRESARDLVADPVLPSDFSLPMWVGVIDDITAAMALTEDAAAVREPEHLPFQEICAPFVEWTWKRLAEQASTGLARLSPDAVASLQASLGRWVNLLIAPTLEGEFAAFRAVRQQLSGGIQILGSLPGVVTREQYRSFVHEILHGGFRRMMLEFPVLARQLGSVVEMWVASESAFLRHLDGDWKEIAATFGFDETVVSRLRTDLSDRHNGGHTVKIVTFSDAHQVVYKPKPVGLEFAFSEFQDWLNSHLPTPEDLRFRTIRVLDCGEHGWVEFISQQPCADAAAVSRYYTRAGALLALIHALEGTDYHNENLIAHGEHPVPIDQEGLFHHRARLVNSEGRGINADVTADNRLARSVIRTALLPYWRFGENGRSMDISGLGGESDQEGLVKVPSWQNINTDQMRVVYEYFTSRQLNGNVVVLDGVAQSANDHIDDLVAGFTTLYRALLAQRSAVLAAGGPLEKFANQRVRFIYRDTRVYFVLQRHSLHPRFLRDGVERSIQLEILHRGLLPSAGTAANPLLDLVQAEIAAMERMDIPMFQPLASSSDLRLESDHTITGCFFEPSFESVRNRLADLSEHDLDEQVRVIRGALLTRTIRPQQERVGEVTSTVGGTRFAPLAPEVLVDEAVAIARRIASRAIRDAQGHASWMGFVHVVEANRAQLQQLPWRLYDGSPGVALFLGALCRILRERGESADEFHQLATATIRPIVKGLTALRDKRLKLTPFTRECGLGAGLGVCSLIYTLRHLADWLDDPSLLVWVRELAGGISPEVIAADSKFDLMFGSAGAMLALSSLHRHAPDPLLLSQANLCAEHLLAKRLPEPPGRRTWGEPGHRPLTGLSHGASGYALALLSLHRETGSPKLLDAAREAIAYEHSVYREDARNWPDFRPPTREPAPCWCSWCHGAPGILLARVEALDQLDSGEIQRDIASAISTTISRSLTPIDHLCCGNLGRADILLTTSLRLDRPELLETAGGITAEVVTRARQSGSYGLGNDPDFSLNFFQGLAGVGYALLRQAHTSLLPSVLSWE